MAEELLLTFVLCYHNFIKEKVIFFSSFTFYTLILFFFSIFLTQIKFCVENKNGKRK